MLTFSDIIEKVNTIKWYHEFKFPQGIIAKSKAVDVVFHRALWKFINDHLINIDFKDKTVLDIGCWDGKWSFLAEQRGAKLVLATDDINQNWSTGEGLLIAAQLFNSSIKINQHINVYDIASLNEKFDIILFLGVYYHLYDPFYALVQIRHCCHKDSIVIIEGSVGCNYKPGETRYCLDDPTQSVFLPDERVWNQLIRAAYLNVEKEFYFSTEMLQAQKHLIQQDYADRKLLFCKPFEGANNLHYYTAPFGLQKYMGR